MVDIHTHILPDFDDGAVNDSDAVLMLRFAYEGGTTDLVVSPHCFNDAKTKYSSSPMFIEDAYDKLCGIVRKSGLPINIYCGSEVFGAPQLFAGRTPPEFITLNNSGYILVEFDFDEEFEAVQFVVRNLLGMGYKVIIAHPERYSFVQRSPSPVHWFIDKGCFLQLNKGSLHGNYGSRCAVVADYILKNRFASFVASDAHDPFRRNPSLKKEYELYVSRYGQEYSDQLFTLNGQRVLNNEDLQVLKF